MSGTLGILIWIAYFVSLYVLIYWLVFYLERRSTIHAERNAKPVPKKYSLVTIVVPAFNEERTIIGTLRSLNALSYPKDKLEILVVDDGSVDTTSEIVKEFIKGHPGFPGKLISKQNGGKGSALNLALRKAKGTFFACLDADSFVQPLILKHQLAMFERNPALVVVTPVMKIHNPKTMIQRFQRLEYVAAMLLTKLLGYMDSNFVAPGPFSVYRTAMLRKIGGFDEKSLIEDQEVVYRIQEKHYKIAQCPAAHVYTVAPSNLSQLKSQRVRWSKGTLINLITYRKMAFNKRYGDFGLFMIPLHIFGFFLAFLAVTSFLYYTLKPVFLHFKQLWLTNFDIVTYMRSLTWNFNVLNFEATLSFIIYTALFLGFIFLLIASRMTKDKIRAHGGISILLYFL
ncbi:MAG: glycosyltransferase, partial [Candidatus Woesearchaeota archaeon]